MDKWFFLRFLQFQSASHADLLQIFNAFSSVISPFSIGDILISVSVPMHSHKHIPVFTVFYHSIFTYDEEGELCYLQM